jgi:hypothetical protein
MRAEPSVDTASRSESKLPSLNNDRNPLEQKRPLTSFHDGCDFDGNQQIEFNGIEVDDSGLTVRINDEVRRGQVR